MIRLVNIVELLAIIATLSCQHFYTRPETALAHRVRSGALMVVFAILAYVTIQHYSNGTPVMSSVRVFTFGLGLYLLTLWAPWTWPARWRARRDPPSDA